MRARGIDPGGTIGWCDIERVSAGVFRFVACGTWEASEVKRGSQALAHGLTVDTYSIEVPEEMHHNDVIGAFRAAEIALKLRPSKNGIVPAAVGPGCARIMQKVRNLLETRGLAERIACAVAPFGRVVEPTAAKCRGAFGIRFGAQRAKGDERTVDQQIAALLPLAVRDWPKRSNVHVRDAAMCALWALGPAEVEAAFAGRRVVAAERDQRSAEMIAARLAEAERVAT